MIKIKKFNEAEYKGKDVELEKPFRLKNDKNKKFGVYVKNEKGNVILVKFGDPNMEIKRDNPERQKAFWKRHNCDSKKDKTTPGYWSCKFWQKNTSVNDLLESNSFLYAKTKDNKVIKVPILEEWSTTNTKGIPFVITKGDLYLDGEYISESDSYVFRHYPTGIIVSQSDRKNDLISKFFKMVDNAKFELFIDALTKNKEILNR